MRHQRSRPHAASGVSQEAESVTEAGQDTQTAPAKNKIKPTVPDPGITYPPQGLGIRAARVPRRGINMSDATTIQRGYRVLPESTSTAIRSDEVATAGMISVIAPS